MSESEEKLVKQERLSVGTLRNLLAQGNTLIEESQGENGM